MSQYIEEFEKKQLVENDYPQVGVGDTVVVHKQISEGKKTRIQRFQGLIIKKTGQHSRESITLRKIVDGVGVEKSFFICSPLVKNIEVVTKGKGRRARLNYLRDRKGKAALRVKNIDN
ncbi:50S ribosomal protein L19 [Candidatus Marinamargulisbacteria bacterium SCGC AG-343-K17]|nr:50S ribosomal protein L19 [Candidatus Marinamargulisbacteria bacterium SCGC AG-343-K17]